MPSMARQDLGESCFAELADIYPDGSEDELSFGFRLPQSDPRVGRLLSVLARHGMKPKKGFLDGPGFHYQLRRTYSVKDWNEARLLTIMPRNWTMIYNLPGGQIGFIAREANHKADLIGDKQCHRVLLVPDRVKRGLEHANLRHLRFQSAVQLSSVVDKLGPIPLKSNSQRLGQWWVLASDLILPQLSITCDVRLVPDRKGLHGNEPPFPRMQDDPPYVSLHERQFIHAELHYRAAEIDKLPEFDAAMSREVFGNTLVGPSRELIVSNRFYKVCRALELRVSWQPVRLV